MLGTEQAYDCRAVENGFIISEALDRGDMLVGMFVESCHVLSTTLIACIFELVG